MQDKKMIAAAIDIIKEIQIMTFKGIIKVPLV